MSAVGLTTVGRPSRSPETVREEIEDLRSYLAGLPSEWRESGSFLAYEEKLAALDQELALGRIAELASTLPGETRRDHSTSELSDAQEHLADLLEKSGKFYAQLAATHARRNRGLNLAALVASSATAAFALLLPVGAFVIPAAATAAGAAGAMALFRWSERSQEEAKVADYLMALRNEVMHLQDPDVKGAFRTSARVEALIAEVRRTRAENPHRADQPAPVFE